MAKWAICTNRECRVEDGNPTHWLLERDPERTAANASYGISMEPKARICPKCGQQVVSECLNERCRKPFDDSLGFRVTDVYCRHCGERFRLGEEKPMEPMM